ncbi:hypothetical protein [Fundidesulfovibrio terrae]|uniref:hypothetical protein n=1 Tax=Fundidesulfovibrio terrae TaxID=2922866 RepID=UPI001FB020F7|nr:hypothetical protein [Fundidesulfovibrio terrae]
MPPSESQLAILNAVAQFSVLARYHGVMPSKHAVAYRDEDVAGLVDQGLLEWAHFTYGCGKELKGLRITPAGERAAAGRGDSPSGEGSELAYEHLLILKDVFHFSRMPRYRRMMPEKKAKRYVACDFEDLINRGYILKIKLKIQGEHTLKGYVISAKGERELAGARMA